MRRLLTRFFDLREGEGPLAAKAFLTLFFTIAAHTILETARDALFLSKLPPSQLNVVYIAVAALSFVAAAATTRFAARFGRRNALLCALVFAAYVTTLLHFFAPGPRVALVLYVFSGLVGAVVIPQFWLLAAQMFTVSQGRRLFGPVASGGVLGGVIGASLAAGVLSFASVTTLLVVSAGLFLATAFLSASIAVDDAPPPPVSAPTAMRESLRELFKSNPFLTRIAWLVALSTAAVLVVDYLFKSTAARMIPPDSLGSFFARFYAAMNAVSLVVQLLLATRLLRRLGVVGAVAVMPLLLTLGGAGAFAVGGTLAAALLTKTVDGGLRHSLNRIATELLYLPVPTEARERGKALVDGVVSRIAQAVTAALLFVLATRGLASPRLLAAMIAALAAAWLLTALLSRGRYLDLFRAALAGGTLDASPVDVELDLASAAALVEAMASPDPVRVIAAMNLLAQKKHAKIIPALVLHHGDEGVLRRALEIFAESDRTDWHPLGERLLSHASEEIRIATLGALARHGVVRAIEGATEDPSSRVQAYAAFQLAMCSNEVDLAVHPRISGMLSAPRDEGRAARVGLLWAIADAPAPCAANVLLALARDAGVLAAPDAPARLAHAMGLLGDARFVPALVARLPTRAGREAVRDALVKIGDPAFDALARALHDEATDPRVRVHLPRTIGRFATQRACDLLTDQLEIEKVGLVRYKVLRGLGLLVGAHVKIDRPRIAAEAHRTLADHLRTLARRVAIAGNRARQASRAPLGDAAADLLTGLLDDKLDQSLERVFRLLKLAHPREDLHRVHIVTKTGDHRARANAIEYLDALLAGPAEQALRDLLRIVLDDVDDAERVARAAAYLGELPSTEHVAVSLIMEEHDDALAALAAHHALTLGAPSLRAAVERAYELRPSLVSLGEQWFGTTEVRDD